MPCAGVNHLRVHGIDGNGFDLMQFRASHGADQLPRSAAVFASINSGECTGNKYFRIRGSLCQSADGLALHVADGIPVMTFVLTDINSAVRLVQSPGSDQDALGIRFIEDDVVDDQRIVRSDLAQSCPVLGIVGFIYPAVGGPEEDMGGGCRAIRKTAGVSAIRANSTPLLRVCTGSTKTDQTENDCCNRGGYSSHVVNHPCVSLYKFGGKSETHPSDSAGVMHH